MNVGERLSECGMRLFRGATWAMWLALSLVVSGGLVTAGDEPPEPSIARLEFRVLDAEPGGGPVSAFRYSYDFFNAAQEEPSLQRDRTYQCTDGILRISESLPPFGRIRVWIEADDPRKGYRHGYGSFSYRPDTDKPSEPAPIRLEQGIVVTGKVLDADTGKPVAGAELAPMKSGHHSDWADWEEAVKTDGEGKYRLATQEARGIAVRHPQYRDEEPMRSVWEFGPGQNQIGPPWIPEPDSYAKDKPAIGPDGVVVRLQPLMALRGRAVDPQGKPIAGVSCGGCDGDESDAEGRFSVKATKQEWADREREDARISFYAEKYRSTEVPLTSFSLDRETVVTLQPEQVIRGQVFDANGKPLEDCLIELKCDAKPFVSDFYTVPGPYQEGKWEQEINEHDTDFTLRISVGGSIRSLQQYTREQVTGGPIITKLAEGRRLIGRLVACVPLDSVNTPAVMLRSKEHENVCLQAKVDAGGAFTFPGLTEGTYTLTLEPAVRTQRGGHMNPGVGAFTTFGTESPNKPWERSIVIGRSDIALEPIDLHEAAVLPGRVTGVAFWPTGEQQPFANAFGYICASERDFDTVGGSYYFLNFMTDAEGRFRVDHCPPGKYVLRLTENAGGYGYGSPAVWIRVPPEKAIDLRLFAPEADHCLAIDFVVGDGSPGDVHAGAGLDAAAIARHVDPKTGEWPYIEDEQERLRVQPSEIGYRLDPLDDTATYWPVPSREVEFQFSPANLLKDNLRDIVIPNVLPGRWRLTIAASYNAVNSAREIMLVRDFAFTAGMAPLRVELPASSLAGTFENPASGVWSYTTIEAIPQQTGLPTRTCQAQKNFRFLGLVPGAYSLRFRDDDCETKVVGPVRVEKGKTTWVEKVVLQRQPGK